MKIPIPFLICSLLILLTACNPSGDIGAQKETQALQAAASETPSSPTHTPTPLVTPTSDPLLQVPLDQLDGLQIDYWHSLSGDMSQVMDSIVGDFNNSNAWGIQVITTSYGGAAGLKDSLKENISAARRPDVILSSSEQLLMWEAQYDFFADLNLYITDGQWRLTDQEKLDIPQIYWEQDKTNEKQLAVPALRDMHVLFYNKSWAQDLGYTQAPLTFGDFSNQVCAASTERKNIDETGGWIINTDPLTTYSWLIAGKTNPYDPENDAYRFDTHEVAQVFSELKNLSIKGCLWNARLPEPYDYFAGRQALMYSGTLSDVIPQTIAMKKKQNSDEWLVIPYPSGEDNPPVMIDGSSYTILETTPAEQLASWLFLRWLLLPRHQAALSSAGGYLPVSSSALSEMQDFAGQYPQWSEAGQWILQAASAPHSGSWTMVQNLLEDAAWQNYQTFTAVENIPVLLKELDAMIPEVLRENGLE